ncbi:MAG: hypothetical protein IH594_11210 [Bacteroidales bacterium]|nr:hypothetical protein [Bacteroidales bacterium]
MNRKATGLIFIERRPGYKAVIQGGLKASLKKRRKIKKKPFSIADDISFIFSLSIKDYMAKITTLVIYGMMKIKLALQAANSNTYLTQGAVQ